MRPLRHSIKRLRKRQRKVRRRRRASRILAIAGLLLLAILVLPNVGWPFRAEASTQRDAPQQFARPAFGPEVSNASQIHYDDLTVASGDVLTGDIVVTSGDVKIENKGEIQGNLTLFSGDITIEDGGAIRGSLVTYSGDVELERGGTVESDVSSWSGDVTVDGWVGGNLVTASGDVRLGESAQIDGDISVLSGEVKREQGAAVGGSVMTGPSFKFMTGPAFLSDMMRGRPEMQPAEPPAPPAMEAEVPGSGRGDAAAPWGRRLGVFVLSLIGATVFAFVAMLISGLLAAVWPQYVQKIETNSRQQLPLSFALGLLTNVSLLLVSLVLVALVCTIPFALVLMLGMVAINVAGWTALSSAVGRRVTTQSQASIQPAVRVAVGALVLTAPLALLSAFGGCLRFIAILSTLLLASAGAGAVVQDLLDQWAERSRRRQANGTAGNDDGAGPSAGGTPLFQSGRFAPHADADVDPALGDLPVDDFAVDDFTRIQGIDEDADGRLLEAGITSFAQLAALTPEELADILGWPVERVVNENLIGRAEILAELS